MEKARNDSISGQYGKPSLLSEQNKNVGMEWKNQLPPRALERKGASGNLGRKSNWILGQARYRYVFIGAYHGEMIEAPGATGSHTGVIGCEFT